jgi:hypothetical protein
MIERREFITLLGSEAGLSQLQRRLGCRPLSSQQDLAAFATSSSLT